MSEKTNYHAIRYGNYDGEIKFGHIHADNNISAAMLRNGASKDHYITLDRTGEDFRKHGTICRSPGSFQVQAGNKTPTGEPAIFLDANNGDIVIRCPSGRIRMEAENIDILANGGEGGSGVINIEANDKILMKSQTIDVSSKVSTKVFSEKNVEVVGNAILNIYGGLIDAADGATSVKGSKTPSTNEIQNKPGAIAA